MKNNTYKCVCPVCGTHHTVEAILMSGETVMVFNQRFMLHACPNCVNDVEGLKKSFYHGMTNEARQKMDETVFEELVKQNNH